jgi:hypothetical protein
VKAPPGHYSPWIRRAESFVRHLNHLPGRWGISIAIEPPLPASEADELAKSLPFGLPTPLRALYTEGAARCRCRYHWTPDENCLPPVQELFPYETSIYGGPEFIPWNKLLDAHAVHTWWDGLDEDLTKEQAIAREVWRHTIPFIDVGNGDCVALHVTDNPESLPVVYLCHDDQDRPVTPLSTSLDQFLADWESLCYLGPEIWLLCPFLGEDGQGPVAIDPKKACRWSEVLLGKRSARP